MEYTNGGLPAVGDRVTNITGRLGTVFEVSKNGNTVPQIAIKWDDGVIPITYNRIDEFKLVQRR
jgi:hypothetical protein